MLLCGKEVSRTLPLERTARHSSVDLWSGYDMLLDCLELDPNKLPKNGMVGIDFNDDGLRDMDG